MMVTALEAEQRFQAGHQESLNALYQFRKQNPFQSSYSKRIKDEQWHIREDIIRSMHTSGKTRIQMLNSLREEDGFCPS